MLLNVEMQVMILYCYIFEENRLFRICNSKLRLRINCGKLFTNGISLELFSKECRVGNVE